MALSLWKKIKDLLTPSLHLMFLIVTLRTIVIMDDQNVKDYFDMAYIRRK